MKRTWTDDGQRVITSEIRGGRVHVQTDGFDATLPCTPFMLEMLAEKLRKLAREVRA